VEGRRLAVDRVVGPGAKKQVWPRYGPDLLGDPKN